MKAIILSVFAVVTILAGTANFAEAGIRDNVQKRHENRVERREDRRENRHERRQDRRENRRERRQDRREDRRENRTNLIQNNTTSAGANAGQNQ